MWRMAALWMTFVGIEADLSCYQCIKEINVSTSEERIFDLYNFPLIELKECPVMICPEDFDEICVKATEPYSISVAAKYEHLFCSVTEIDGNTVDQCEFIGITDELCTYEAWGTSPVSCPICTVEKDQYCPDSLQTAPPHLVLSTLINMTLSGKRRLRSAVRECNHTPCNPGVTHCGYHETFCDLGLTGCFKGGKCHRNDECYDPLNPGLCDRLTPCTVNCPQCNISLYETEVDAELAKCNMISCSTCGVTLDGCHITTGCAPDCPTCTNYSCKDDINECLLDEIRSLQQNFSEADDKVHCKTSSSARQQLPLKHVIVLLCSVIAYCFVQ